ncbi:hypothetical protein PAMP_018262 [Pampus punctatissimus]
MGNRQSAKEEEQDKHPLIKDAKEAAVKKEIDQSSVAKLPTPTSPDDLNHSKSKDLTGNLKNAATTSQGRGPTKLISHSEEPSNGKEVIFTSEQKVSAVNEKREESISQDPDQVKSICPAKPKDRKSKISKPRLQQATPARPAVVGVKSHAGDFDALSEVVRDVSTSTKPPNHSTQISNQPNTQVNTEENALQEPGLNFNVTKLVEHQYHFTSETSRANAAKMRLKQKLAKKLDAQSQDDSKSTEQTSEGTVTATMQESLQQQGCTDIEAKKHKEPHQIPRLDKDDDDTNEKPSSCIQKVNMKAPEPQTEGRWHPFTVNQSCFTKARCHHNPGTGLQPNVQKWFDECPNYLRKPPKVITAKHGTGGDALQ